MTPDHCAGLLQKADPDRFASVMAAQPGDRAKLATLYAANLEIAQAALSSKEPLVSEMRLQWWADQIDRMQRSQIPDKHPVALPLANSWGADVAPLADLIEARRRDALREPFETEAEVLAHIDGCTGTLMRMAAAACGLFDRDELLRDQSRGAGLAAWLSAYPRLRSLNLGVFGDRSDLLKGLAGQGIAALDAAKAAEDVPRRAAPALFAGAGARSKLNAAKAGEAAEVSRFSRNLAYLRLAVLGHWRG
ncbi:phytoene synthase [Paracoccus aurantiacus]|uniref:Phytoene synthase n=1 Tax=Paracoccus aurantiacus TaxID=2599412 RepID=A0A5C6S776_9RHOB|nr:squalene/phytoene synthase family protein [Paracoccus aurantiacus]TXB70749.1 phytoene synthase [Paracoccus aurantiacus]